MDNIEMKSANGFGSSYTGNSGHQMSTQTSGLAAGHSSNLLGAAVLNERNNFAGNSYFSSANAAYNTNVGQSSGECFFSLFYFYWIHTYINFDIRK